MTKKLDVTSDTFKALKRKARSVKARPRRKTGAGGVEVAPVVETSIDSVASQNITQKEFKAASVPVINAEVTPESRWRASGQIDATVYCKPLNPRLLLIRLDDKTNGRVEVKPSLQPRFGTGKRIWVTPTSRPGLYTLVGTYTMWGKRVA